jgi:general secretion pathway protein A
MTPRELLATICEEVGVETEGITDSNKLMVDALNDYLLKQHAKGRHVVVVIDEAQNLSPEALEQVRLLTNLETTKEKLLQMVLLGQPELRQLLQRQNLRQLSQRITARYHLAPLNQEETLAYVKHRMQVAGAQSNPFRPAAMRALYQRSGGVPRLINIIADRSLSGAYARESGNVTSALVHAAANEVQPSETRVHSSRWPLAVATASATTLVLVSLLMWGSPLLDRIRSSAVEKSLDVAQSAPLPESVVPATEVAEQAGQSEPVADHVAVGAYPGDLIIAQAPLLRIEPGWLEDQHRTVWRSFAELWQDDGSANAIALACDGVTGTGYACLRDRGSWSRIRKLGLPVILVLQDNSSRLLLFRGFSQHGLLVGSSDDVNEVSRDAVEARWLGEYIVAWPQAPDWPRQIGRGESGAAVDIVMEMAGMADPAWSGAGIFDSGFEAWLMTFQRQHGLEADGIVGPNTLIHLMAPTINRPRLILTAAEKS